MLAEAIPPTALRRQQRLGDEMIFNELSLASTQRSALATRLGVEGARESELRQFDKDLPRVVILLTAIFASSCSSMPFAPHTHAQAANSVFQRPGQSADVGPHLNNYSQATVPLDGTMVVRGDDFLNSDKVEAPPKRGKVQPTISLADALAAATKLKVLDQEFPGETLSAAAKRLAEQAVGNLMVICFGYGDGAAHTDVGQFRQQLVQMIRGAHERGAAVYLVVEPATTLSGSSAAEPFRGVMREVAATEGAGLIDAPTILAAAQLGPNKTRRQTKPAVNLVAGFLAQYVLYAPANGDPA